MQIDRLFEIVYILMNRSVTAKKLAEQLGVSERTIMRDIDVLTIAGIPVQTTQGKGGGISLPKSFVLNKTQLSEGEQRQILFALQSVAATKNVDVDKALGKLTPLFGAGASDWIEIDFSRWGTALSDREKFEKVKYAILNCNTVRFRYAGSNGENSERKVYPLKFVLKLNAWYVQAFCLNKNAYRTFKLNRMTDITVLPDKFVSSDFRPPRIDTDSADVELVHVVVEFAPSVRYRVYDEFAPESVTQNADGSATVSVDLPPGDWLYGYLLTFGDSARVLSPDFIKEGLKERAKKITKIYEI